MEKLVEGIHHFASQTFSEQRGPFVALGRAIPCAVVLTDALGVRRDACFARTYTPTNADRAPHATPDTGSCVRSRLMKFSSSQLAYLVGNREARGNLRALLKYVLTLVALITLYAVVFHVIKVRVEGEQHSWITGFYWTLVVMTTLGFGDITFTSDTGRLFSIVVLLSGVVLLLVMLPFMFISLFYAPWLEARVRLRAPREVPEGTRGHVILTEYDAIAIGLI